MYHLFWTNDPAMGPWQHETFDDLPALDARRAELLQAAAAGQTTPLMRAFHFPDATGQPPDLALMLTWLERLARFELPSGASEMAGVADVAAARTTSARAGVHVRVGSRSYLLNDADSRWLETAIRDTVQAPASEEFLQLEPPDALMVIVLDSVETEFELYDGWSTLADLVTGHWPFPAGTRLRDKIAAGQVAESGPAPD